MAPSSHEKSEPPDASRPSSSAYQMPSPTSHEASPPQSPPPPPPFTSFPSTHSTSYPPPRTSTSIPTSLADDHDDSDENPLIAFRRFADAQIGALLQGFVGLPSAFERLPPPEMENPEDPEARAPSRRERRWRGRCTRHRHAELAEGGEASLAGAQPAANAAMLTHYLLHDAYSPLALENDPVLGRMNWRAAFADLINAGSDSDSTIAASPHQPPREWAVTTAQSWALQRRAAPAHTGLVMAFPSLHALHAPWDRGLADAMHGIEHGPSVRNAIRREKREAQAHIHATAQEQEQEQELPGTELDMYERFLDGLRPADASRAMRPAATRPDEATLQTKTKPATTATPASTLAPPATQQAEEQPHALATPPPLREPGLVATLTTTEQVVLPDGTTHTKVALKKRFRDGREERKETVLHTMHDDPTQQDEPRPSWAQTQMQMQKQKQAPAQNDRSPGASADPRGVTERKKGWFWS